MDRRGFLKGIAAAAAAFAAAKAAVAGAAPPACGKIGACVTADTSKFAKRLGEAAAAVEEYLKKCRAVEVWVEASVDGRHSVLVRYAPGDGPRTTLDDQADEAMQTGTLLSVKVTTTGSPFPPYTPRHEIEVEWLIPRE